MWTLRCFIGVVLAAAAAPTSCLESTPPPTPLPEEQGPEEILLGATAQRAVIARVEYPAGTTVDSALAGTAAVQRLWVLGLDIETFAKTWLQDVFGSPLQRVPIADGRFLAGIVAGGGVWLADLDDNSTRQLPLDDPSGSLQLWAIRDPWLIGSDAAGPFALHLTSLQRVNLPAGIRPSPVVIDPTYLGFLQAAPGSAESAPVDIQLMNLISGQVFTLAAGADADATQLFMQPDQLTYVQYDKGEDAYYIRVRSFSTGLSTIEMRVPATPVPGEFLHLADVSLHGYLMIQDVLSPVRTPSERLVNIRRSGEREMIHEYGLNTPHPRGQPRFAGSWLIWVDQEDGAWSFSNVVTLTSRRDYLFRGVQ